MTKRTGPANWWLSAINATNLPYNGNGVKLAVMDTGISVHPDFFVNDNPQDSRIVLSQNFASDNGVIDPNYKYDDYGHGTHVAGIAGGDGYLSNGQYTGVAPGVELVDARIFNSSAESTDEWELSALEWCEMNHVNIISMSFGDGVNDVWNLENIAIDNAVNDGIIVVAAAGNSGPDFYTAGSPGTGMDAISVGATDIDNHVVSFSSSRSLATNQLIPTVCAPGLNIISCLSDGSSLGLDYGYTNNYIDAKDNFAYIALSGTSMATPMVSGACAILKQAFPNATPEAIRNVLIMSATTLNQSSPEGYGAGQGAGLINVGGALSYLNQTQMAFSNVNNQTRMYPRQFHPAPYDFVKFPGDHREFKCDTL